jgi:hypothetical protein
MQDYSYKLTLPFLSRQVGLPELAFIVLANTFFLLPDKVNPTLKNGG